MVGKFNSQQKIVAVVAVRAGSQRVPKKNIRKFHNTNLLELKLNVKVAAEVYPFRKFWIAETYHQDFKKNNTNHPYIINVSNPRFENFKYKFEDIIKD